MNYEYHFGNFRNCRGILCAVVDALIGFGFYSLVSQMNDVSGGLAAVTAVCSYVSVIAGFFIHTVLCIQPIIYKKIMETDNFKLADDTLEAYYKAVIPLFLIAYLFMLVAAICVVVAILKGFLDVPKWFVLLNPFVFLLEDKFIGIRLIIIDK